VYVSLVYPVGTITEFHAAMRENFGFGAEGIGPRQTAGQVAEAMLRCVRRPRPEVYPHALSRALAVLAVVAPGLCDRVVKRYGRRRAAPEREP
jgi:short-subunit dehydrogenase